MTAHDTRTGDDRRRERLIDWLRHVPIDETERAHVASMNRLLAGPGDPFARSHFAPGHFTASAFVLAPDGDELALVFHEALERWLQPGGHVEAGDVDLLAAARREVREELGLERLTLVGTAPLDFDIHPIPARRDEPAHRHFDVRFLLRASSRTLRAGDGVREACWVPARRIADGGERSMRRVLAKL